MHPSLSQYDLPHSSPNCSHHILTYCLHDLLARMSFDPLIHIFQFVQNHLQSCNPTLTSACPLSIIPVLQVTNFVKPGTLDQLILSYKSVLLSLCFMPWALPAPQYIPGTFFCVFLFVVLYTSLHFNHLLLAEISPTKTCTSHHLLL